MAKRLAPVPRHLAVPHQSITPAMRFQRLPIWVSRTDIAAYFKVSKVDAQALIDSADRRCLIDGVEKFPNTSSKHCPVKLRASCCELLH